MVPAYTISDFSPFNKQNQFLIIPFEELKQPDAFIWPHKHNFYEIVWIREGRSKHVIDYHTIDLVSDIIFFMSPGQVHLFEEYESVKGDCIMFTEEFFALNFTNKEAQQKLSFLDSSYEYPCVVLNEYTRNELEMIVKLMYSEFSLTDHSKIALSSLLYVFLNSMQRSYDFQNNTYDTSGQVPVFARFKAILEASFKEEKSVSFYASQLFVTPHQLNKIIKKIAGNTASEIIHERVMLEAKRMLVHTQFPVGQIADMLGFRDFSYFCRQFKKYNSLTPDRYRMTMHEKYQLKSD